MFIRTEQLRKLGKLQCCYLDQFNQKESSYATSRGCRAALQSEPQRGGSLHPGLCLPGKCSGHWVTLSICVFCMHNINNTPVSMLDPRCNVAVIPLFLRKDGLPLEQLQLPAANTPVVCRRSTLSRQSCISVGIYPLLTDPWDRVSAGD